MKVHDGEPANIRNLIYFVIMDDDMPTVGRMAPEWVDFFIMAGAIMLVAIGALIWVFFFRKPKAAAAQIPPSS